MDSGEEVILCREDYFKRINLVCAGCNEFIDDVHVSVLGRNYHLDHFACAVCGETFDGKGSYFEHKGAIYCQMHYSSTFALQCGGCGNPVLKNFVKYRTCSGSMQHWHPQCFMIYKLWDVKINNPFTQPDSRKLDVIALPTDSDASNTDGGKSPDTIRRPGLHCIGKILKTLTAFEEDAADCISDACIYFSDNKYPETILQAARLVSHVKSLFKALTFVSSGVYAKTGEKSFGSLIEPRNLTKQAAMFLSSFMRPSPSKSGSNDKPLKETVVLVTKLAQTLKLTIEVSLRIALRLETQLMKPMSLVTFLEIMETPKKKTTKSILISTIGSIRRKRCVACSATADQTCIIHNELYWHSACAKCFVCGRPVTESLSTASLDIETKNVYCSYHIGPNNVMGFKKISFVICYVLLLEISLINLCAHFGIKRKSAPLSRNASTNLPILLSLQSASADSEVLLNHSELSCEESKASSPLTSRIIDGIRDSVGSL